MKASFAFALGVATGAIIASSLLLISRGDQRSSAADVRTIGIPSTQGSKSAEYDNAAKPAAAQRREAPSAAEAVRPRDTQTARPSDPSVAIYYGPPPPAPANLDRRYSPEEILSTFRDLTDTLGVKSDRLGVDATEFPFFVHGRLEGAAGEDFFKGVETNLRALPGYTFAGGFTKKTPATQGYTYFTLSITPESEYPPEHAAAIRERMFIRMRMTAAAWGE